MIKKTTFTIRFDADFRPYTFVKDGKFAGFDIEMATEVAKRNGWEIQFRPIEWNAKDQELNMGQIDCIWSGFTINGRESKYTWSAPYLDNTQVFVVRQNSAIKTIADLKGKIVACQSDTPAHSALILGGQHYRLGKTFKKIVVTPNYNNAFMELEGETVDAVIVDIGVAQAKLQSNHEFIILQEELMKERYGVGFRKGNTQLRNIVQKTLNDMITDGTAEVIFRKYFN